MKKIGVLTSGGDAPGMNAAIRAVVRTAIFNKLEVVGVRRGYDGLIDADFIPMQSSSVSNILQRGGTILKTMRSQRFMTVEGRQKAYDNLIANDIDALVVIGGDGTFTGAAVFNKEHEFSIVGLPGTIDNDLIGTDFTIGYDTALNTVVEAVDKIRDTADSHNRLFIVEVMGKDAGFIALRSGIGAGAEAILYPESEVFIDHLMMKLEDGKRRQKQSSIIIVAEGSKEGGAAEVAKKVNERFDYDTRVVVLGHVQRGGSPSCMERVRASQMGNAAVEALLQGKKNVMIGIVDKKIAYTQFENAIKHTGKLNPDLLKLVDILSI
ncbi:MAG: 6-phosphofructokinase [Bacteroidetes bacterium]|nr:6-phosphofructokinase [Bacteroidota bacterium]